MLAPVQKPAGRSLPNRITPRCGSPNSWAAGSDGPEFWQSECRPGESSRGSNWSNLTDFVTEITPTST